MALIPLPRRTQSSRLPHHRLIREVREGLVDLPSRAALPDISDVVDAALDIGARYRPVAVARRRRRARTTGLLIGALALGALALAYRWWRGREHDRVRLDPPADDPGGAPSEATPGPPPAVARSADEGDSGLPITPARHESTGRPALAQLVEPADECTPASPRAAIASPLRRPARTAASAPMRPQWHYYGRGPAATPPPVPVARPVVPRRPLPHLPR